MQTSTPYVEDNGYNLPTTITAHCSKSFLCHGSAKLDQFNRVHNLNK